MWECWSPDVREQPCMVNGRAGTGPVDGGVTEPKRRQAAEPDQATILYEYSTYSTLTYHARPGWSLIADETGRGTPRRTRKPGPRLGHGRPAETSARTPLEAA